MKGVPGEPEFEREYRHLIDLHRSGQTSDTAVSQDEGTYRWLAGRYISEMDTLVDQGLLAPATRKQRMNLITRTLERWGDGRLDTLRAEHVRKIMADFRATPGQANNVLKTLRVMLDFAVEEGLIPENPGSQVKRYKMHGDGFTAWSREQLLMFLDTHTIGTQAHLAMMLLLGTACRRSDLVLLGPKHVQEAGGRQKLTFTQAKHKFKEDTRVTVPIIRPLHEAMAPLDSYAETFLVTEYGEPFSKSGFGNRFRKWCDEAGLPRDLSTHGVRKAVGALLADAGCSEYEIMAFHGHADARTSEIYTRTANRKLLANNAADKAALDDLLN